METKLKLTYNLFFFDIFAFMENKRITLLNLVWVMFLFLTFTEFNWFFLTMSVIIAPLWSEIYNVAKINQNAKKQNEPIIEQFEEDLKNGNY